MLDFDADETRVVMSAEARPGEKAPAAMSFTVSSRFGAPRTRFAQAILRKLGSRMAYLEAWSGATRVAQACVPDVSSATFVGDGARDGIAAAAAKFAEEAAYRKLAVKAYGSDRVRWVLSFDSRAAGRDGAETSGARGSADGMDGTAGAPGPLRGAF